METRMRIKVKYTDTNFQEHGFITDLPLGKLMSSSDREEAIKKIIFDDAITDWNYQEIKKGTYYEANGFRR